MKVLRGLIAACCVLVGLAAPAQAQGCTSTLVNTLRGQILAPSPDDPPYPIVVVGDDLSVHVYPQNVVPAANHSVDSVTGYVDGIVGAVGAWVDCVA